MTRKTPRKRRRRPRRADRFGAYDGEFELKPLPTREGVYVRADGTLDEASFHEELLDNAEADLATRRASFRRAVEGGAPRAEALEAYGLTEDDVS